MMKITLAVATAAAVLATAPLLAPAKAPKASRWPKASTFRSDRTATAIIATITTGKRREPRPSRLASVRAASEVGPGESAAAR